MVDHGVYSVTSFPYDLPDLFPRQTMRRLRFQLGLLNFPHHQFLLILNHRMFLLDRFQSHQNQALYRYLEHLCV